MSTAITPRPDSICERLRTTQRGEFDRDMTARVRELVATMTDLADKGVKTPKGKLTITVDFTLDRGIIDVSMDFVVKDPKKVRGRTIVYPGPHGELFDQDPQQGELGLGPARDTVIEAGTTQVRRVG